MDGDDADSGSGDHGGDVLPVVPEAGGVVGDHEVLDGVEAVVDSDPRPAVDTMTSWRLQISSSPWMNCEP